MENVDAVKSRFFIVKNNESRLEPVMLSKKCNLRIDFDAGGNMIGVQWRKENKEWTKS